MAIRSLSLAFFFALTAFQSMTTEASPSPMPHGGHEKDSYIDYTTISGFFLQDDPKTVSSTFDYWFFWSDESQTKVNLGLINRTYDTDQECGSQKTQWERFEYYVKSLNKKAPNNVEYKVLIMGRHGEGFHNVAETYYGTPSWDCYWAQQDGNGTSTWADARLTENGINQANIAHAFWVNALQNAGIPAPDSYYSSPLTRCLETARITYEGLDLPHNKKFKPVVKEKLREAIGRHTCDRRSSKTYIEQTYPGFHIEKGFSEDDKLWEPVLRETDSARAQRLKEALDDIFTNDDGTFIAVSSHSGAIGSILRVIRHIPFGLVTGAVIPALVKVERIGGTAPTTTILGPTPGTTCTANPTRTA
ncbi:phosphoglycerate mutase [Pseudovirgaria hyperparasitica]|uniref:Phosphoglycerate mutase n=1 Tax=Pseudovirgaria hyperparasitica TaxID=470096 RepID=A0A6A6VUM5_9PEZI|nr:phosphoglycerate mutase [Pseudovirgaria hyperparasitica]KAF2753434.1 phosphoglycerate mutase [Pseudovirgaria hyperparasitica]